MNKLALKEIIKEEIFNILKEENNEVKPTIASVKPNIASHISTIEKDLNDQGNNFKQISTKDKMVQILDLIVNKVKEHNPKFAQSATFKQAIRAFAKKHK